MTHYGTYVYIYILKILIVWSLREDTLSRRFTLISAHIQMFHIK